MLSFESALLAVSTLGSEFGRSLSADARFDIDEPGTPGTGRRIKFYEGMSLREKSAAEEIAILYCSNEDNLDADHSMCLLRKRFLGSARKSARNMKRGF